MTSFGDWYDHITDVILFINKLHTYKNIISWIILVGIDLLMLGGLTCYAGFRTLIKGLEIQIKFHNYLLPLLMTKRKQ